MRIEGIFAQAAESARTPGEFAGERYDAIVEPLNGRGISPIAVLHRSPAWIRSPSRSEAFDAPPAG